MSVAFLCSQTIQCVITDYYDLAVITMCVVLWASSDAGSASVAHGARPALVFPSGSKSRSDLT